MNFFRQELNVGAKDVRIFVGGELVWEGVIDKVRTEPDGHIMKNSLWTCKGGGGLGLFTLLDNNRANADSDQAKYRTVRLLIRNLKLRRF